VKGVGGIAQQAPLAKVWVHVGDYSIPLVVAVLENAQDDVLIGRDIGPVFNELMMQQITESRQQEEVTVKVTRAQKTRQEKETTT
jgi:hypothetical protein